MLVFHARDLWFQNSLYLNKSHVMTMETVATSSEKPSVKDIAALKLKLRINRITVLNLVITLVHEWSLSSITI